MAESAEEDNIMQSGRSCCLLCSCKLRPFLRSFVPVTLWSVYLCMGSLMFAAIEEEEAAERREKVLRILEDLPRRFSDLEDFLTQNCSDAVDQVSWVHAMSIGVEGLLDNADFGPSIGSWDFFASLRFCLTAVSTIGYGYLAPKTQLGRGLCILYTAIGLPLNLIFMACVGRHLARLISVLYCKMKKLGSRILSFHKLGLKQHTGKLDTGEATPNGKCVEMIPAEVTVTDHGNENSSVAMSSPNNGTDFSTQYLQWPERDADTRSLSQYSGSDISRSPSRATIAEPVPDFKVKHLHHHDESAPAVPMVFLLLLILGYCCFGAWLMSLKNPLWTFLDGVYFWFITITTVGFGDLEISSEQVSVGKVAHGAVLVQISIIAFIVVGLALMSACVTLCIERGHHYRRISQRIMCNAVGASEERNDNDYRTTLS